MAVKRRASKRRVDVHAELQAWDSIFASGFAFDGDLRQLGLSDDPPPPTIEQAWQRLGARYLIQHGRENAPGELIWALRQLGEPPHAS